MAAYKTCPHCGAHLDPGERCDCRDETEKEPRREADAERKEAKTA